MNHLREPYNAVLNGIDKAVRYKRPNKTILSQSDLDDYLNFARQLAINSRSENEGLLVYAASSEQIDERSLNFLQKCKNNIIRA
jgi:hypothetical protein